MNLNSLFKGEGLYKICGKDSNYYGNKYCIVAEELLDNTILKKKFSETSCSIEDLLLQRLKLMGYQELSFLKTVIGKCNVIGVKRRLQGKSVLKLSNSTYIDRRFADLFENCTYWYHNDDNNVFVVLKNENKILGAIARIRK